MTSSARLVAPLRQLGGVVAGEIPFGPLVAETFKDLRSSSPRVHCLTNSVAQSFTANLLLAAGAIPSMSVAPDEIAHFVLRAGALLVNLGTLDAERRAALPLALEAAAKAGIPVVLDPVFVDASPPRLALAREIIARKPVLLRLNGPEFEALSGSAPQERQIAHFAAATGATIALTGKTDIVSDGENTAQIDNGHPYMAQVTGMGCAAGALLAALLACGNHPFAAAVTGLTALGVAGEIAAKTARGPGSFAVGILDALAALDGKRLAAQARITIGSAP
ncbi:hydroxyethylthiazole kinase [Rhizobiales bacterium GAS191]|jgi:hydroxyethylthiazole kinase|nr:hydroxyethylthiazole kinase [Rhizobiales bacterium GAS113]SEC38823.1 hydroxyethylthiazole kinase [Rhizobiales bacterium GAS191]SEC87100.1 hydroxyethylthiazole kinase [Rhizobiales bacterium GAS188]